MENAGHGLARIAVERFGPLKGKHVLVVCGSGNNGGDGLAAARHLSTFGATVTVAILAKPEEIKTSEASLNWKIINGLRQVFTVRVCDSTDALNDSTPLFSEVDLIVDAIFGTGIKGRIREPQRTAIELVNLSSSPKLAVDLPSGMDPDTGRVTDICVRADVTVTLHKPKPGLLGDKKWVGEMFVAEIGIPPGVDYIAI
jgi:NAD(P)H-hydrate epimerase